jgi:iron(III) transport system permease protein
MARIELPLAIHRTRRTFGLPGWTGLALLWGLAGGAALLLLLPVVYLLLRFGASGPAAWALVLRPATLVTSGRSLGLALAVTAASAIISLPAAWLTTRTDLPGRRSLAVLLALPVVIPSYVGAYLLVAFLGPRGMLAQALGLPGLPAIYGFPGAFLALTLLSYPYVFLSLRAALLGLDPALEEAARSLGYGPWRTFWRVTLPQLRPALAAGGLLVALYVLRDFGAVSIMRYDTFTRVIYVQYQTAFDRSTASGLSLVLVLLTLLLLALDVWTRGRARYARSAAGTRTQPLARLGGWRWPALAFCLSPVLAGLALPVGVLGYWLARGIQAGERLAPLWAAARHSLLASLLAVGCTLLVALPVVVLSVRGPGRWSSLLYQLAYSSYALPGIVVALAMVYFGAHYAFPLYGSLAILLLAYVILFLPQAAGALRAALLQVHGGLEEAARGLGRGPLGVLLHVTLPLVRPGLLAAAAMVFLSAMKELPAALILSPLGFNTLAVRMWSAVSEAFFARAAAPALLLILLSALPAAWITYAERSESL